MRSGAVALVVVVLVLGLAATADAVPRRVAPSEAIGNPALAGSDVVYAGLTARREIEVRRVTPRGRERVVARLGVSPPVREEVVALAASPTHLAAARLSASRIGSETIRAGRLGGPLRPVDFKCAGRQQPDLDLAQPIALDGTRFAYTRESCSDGAGQRRLVIRDLVTGSESGGLPTSGVGVALAGRFAAFRAPDTPDVLHVYDLEQGRVAYAVRAERLMAFDIQRDGKLAVAQYGDSACEGDITWHSPAEPLPHEVGPACGSLAPLAIQSDRIVYSTGGALRVSEVGGGERPVRVRADTPLEGVLGFDGDRVAFATRGCSPDTGAVWTVRVDDRNTSMPRASRCRALVTGGPLQMDGRDRVVVEVSCPGGCRGSLSLRRRGSSYGFRDFELRAGVARRIAIRVRSPREFFGGRRSVRAILNTSVETASGLDSHETNRSVAVRR